MKQSSVIEPSGLALQRILLVEDNPADAEFVELSLEEIPGRAFAVTHVPDLRTALAEVSRTDFDALLLDIGLPDADAGEVLGSLQSAAPDLPVIVLSGMENERLALDFIEQGAQDYLVKGHVDPDRLVRVIDYSMRRKSAVHALKELAQHDPLTGLHNRRTFETQLELFKKRLILVRDQLVAADRAYRDQRAQLERALARRRRSCRRVALLYMDVDGFKPVNDTYGHAVGDELLRLIADRLRGLLREVDTLARLGGDEFAIVLEDVEPADAAAMVAEKVVDCLATPFVVGGTEVRVGVSVGVAMCPDAPAVPADLIRCADAAMYRAKRRGRNCVAFHVDDTLDEQQPAEVDRRLARALELAELDLVYQPQFDLDSGRVACMEALLRWRPEDADSVLMPDSFLAVAERSGLIEPIGAWVLHEAARQARAWVDDGASVKVSVNVSVHQLEERRFPGLVSALLKENGLPPQALELEVGEAGLLHDAERCRRVLQLLAGWGVRIVLDDFGAGYASLVTLQSMPLHVVKLHPACVHATAHEAGRATVRATIEVARSVGLLVAAVGVESAEQLETLRSLGVQRVQGRYLAPPRAATREVPACVALPPAAGG